jgi:hypothetical protein
LYKEFFATLEKNLNVLDELHENQGFGLHTIEPAETGTRYDYSICNDSEAEFYDEKAKEYQNKLKGRQGYLKSLKKGEKAAFVNPETGEVQVSDILPPVKRSNSKYKITLR